MVRKSPFQWINFGMWRWVWTNVLDREARHGAWRCRFFNIVQKLRHPDNGERKTFGLNGYFMDTLVNASNVSYRFTFGGMSKSVSVGTGTTNFKSFETALAIRQSLQSFRCFFVRS